MGEIFFYTIIYKLRINLISHFEINKKNISHFETIENEKLFF